MREQVKLKLDEILDRYEKVMIQLSEEERKEFKKAVLKEIE